MINIMFARAILRINERNIQATRYLLLSFIVIIILLVSLVSPFPTSISIKKL